MDTVYSGAISMPGDRNYDLLNSRKISISSRLLAEREIRIDVGDDVGKDTYYLHLEQ